MYFILPNKGVTNIIDGKIARESDALVLRADKAIPDQIGYLAVMSKSCAHKYLFTGTLVLGDQHIEVSDCYISWAKPSKRYSHQYCLNDISVRLFEAS